MKNKESTSTLEKLELKQLVLKAKIEKLKNQEKTKHRKQETRKKILVGAYYLEKMVSGGKIDELKKEMDKFLDKKSDRALFGLEELEKSQN